MNGRILTALLAICCCGTLRGQTAGPGLTAETDLPSLLKAHNEVRAEHKLPPLSIDAKLTEAARAHAVDMAAHSKMAHEGSDGSTPGERVKRAGYLLQTAGENVAEGYRKVSEVMKGWMDSPPHRENILGEFTQVGFARCEGEDGKLYWAAEFGTPWPEPDPDTARSALLTAINLKRQDAGQPALHAVPKLSKAAERHAADNASRAKIGPDDSDGVAPLERVEKSGYRFRRLGLADASGQATAADALDTWLESDSHKANILGPFRDAGIGYARDGTGKPYWTLILGQPPR